MENSLFSNSSDVKSVFDKLLFGACQISVDGRPNRVNRPPISNFVGVVMKRSSSTTFASSIIAILKLSRDHTVLSVHPLLTPSSSASRSTTCPTPPPALHPPQPLRHTDIWRVTSAKMKTASSSVLSNYLSLFNGKLSDNTRCRTLNRLHFKSNVLSEISANITVNDQRCTQKIIMTKQVSWSNSLPWCSGCLWWLSAKAKTWLQQGPWFFCC